MDALQISIVQSDLYWEDKARNMARFDECLSGLKGRTDLIVLPEMFTTGFSMQPAKLAEQTEGPSLEWMRTKAQHLQAVITGSIIAKQGANYFNRLLWVYPDGTYQHYDKRHLFTLAHEHEHYQAGTERVITTVKGWKVLPLICYDLRFPVWSRNTDNYDLLLYVANWPQMRSKAWSSLLAARAIENQAYTVGVNRIGADGHDIPHTGDSAIFDFTGACLLHAHSVAGVFTTQITRSSQNAFRAKLPFLKDKDRFRIC
jgi:omega-amidase